MPAYVGGPLHGQSGYQEGVDPPEADPRLTGATNMPLGDPAQGGGLAALLGGGAPAGPAAEDDLPEPARFDRVLADLLKLSGGSNTEQNKLALQKAMTLIQQIKASEEKESEQAMSGKPSPRMLQGLYGQASGAAPA
jgi:hypothetical protein